MSVAKKRQSTPSFASVRFFLHRLEAGLVGRFLVAKSDVALRLDDVCEGPLVMPDRTRNREIAIKELDRYLAIPSSIWHYERAFAHIVKSKCYIALGNKEAAYKSCFEAVQEEPNGREGWCALALLCHGHNFAEMFAYSMRALSITQRQNHYCVDPECWESLPHSLACISAWQLGLKDLALEQGKLAVAKKPSSQFQCDRRGESSKLMIDLMKGEK